MGYVADVLEGLNHHSCVQMPLFTWTNISHATHPIVIRPHGSVGLYTPGNATPDGLADPPPVTRTYTQCG